MALHIQMSEEAEAELRRNALRNKLSSVLACALFMLMGFGILYFTAVFIVGDTPVSFLSYTPPSEDGPPTNNPTPRELTSRSSPASSAVAPSVIVATSAASVSMAPVEIDMSEGLSLDSSLDLGLGMGSDLGDGLGSGGSGLGSGQGGGSALEGTFYDLKQTGKGRSRKVSDLATKGGDGTLNINRNKYYEAISNFLNKGWSVSQLSKYYESPNKLYASNFYMPVALARYAPIAYQVGDNKKPQNQWMCQPSGWCVVYRGKVRAPKTGKFRFIGMGDDCIAVRFNRKLVLEGGYRLPSAGPSSPKFQLSTPGGRDAFFKDVKAGRDHDHKGYELINTIEGIGVWGQELGGLMAGAEFSVKEGDTYPIEILVVEEGGKFGFMLFIEDITDGKNSKAKKYDIFRTNFSNPSADEVNELLKAENSNDPSNKISVPYNEDSPIWTAVP
ncbi:MAG: hypothetical protein IKZ13_06845 [Akkermansia sp.]|nr:hypothetical protein [Akkermansia sp.]